MDRKYNIANYFDKHPIDIDHSTGILWPCAIWSGTIHTKKESELNTFEETVLKLCKININDSNTITNELCLKKDLVEFIIKKIQDKGYIDDQNKITKKGENFIDNESEIVEESVNIACDLISGKFIPGFIPNKIKRSRIKTINENNNNIFFKTKGKSYNALMNLIDTKHQIEIIDVNCTTDILTRSIRSYISLNNQFRRFNKKKLNIQKAGTVFKNANLYYMYCELVLPSGNDDFLISDPLGFGYSSILKKSYLDILTKDIKENRFFENFKSQRISKSFQENKISSTSYGIFNKKIEKYKNVSKHIQELERNFIKSDFIPDTENQKKDQNRYINNTIKSTYDLAEWIFKEIITSECDNNMISAYSGFNDVQIEQSSLDLAKNIGFKINDTNSLFKINGSKLKSINYDNAELPPLAVAAIISAKHSINHPLNSLARSNVNIFNILFTLKLKRDTVDHGSLSDNNIEYVKEIKDSIYSILFTLLPNIKKDSNNYVESSNKTQKHILESTRQIADLSLQKNIGWNSYQLLKPTYKELFINIEIYLIELNKRKEMKPECRKIIINLCSIIQKKLFDKLIDHNYNYSTNISIMKWEERLEKHFKIKKHDIPGNLVSVNKRNIQRSIEKVNTTLGGNLIAFIITANSDIFNKLGNQNPNIIDIVSSLLSYRRHGNEFIHLEIEELNRITMDTYELFNSLEEI